MTALQVPEIDIEPLCPDCGVNPLPPRYRDFPSLRCGDCGIEWMRRQAEKYSKIDYEMRKSGGRLYSASPTEK